MVRDRDRIYGAIVTRRLRAMGIRDKPIAPAPPWENGFAERLIGSIRRECLDQCARSSWRDSAGESPAQAGRSGPPGSECCAAVGDGGREAYTAVVWGVGMSHERHNIVGAETVGSVEGNMCGTVTRGADALPGSMATSRTKGSHRNLGDPAFDQQRCCPGPHRGGEES